MKNKLVLLRLTCHAIVLEGGGGGQGISEQHYDCFSFKEISLAFL